MPTNPLKDTLSNIYKDFTQDLKLTKLSIDELYIKYLGKKGTINSALNEIKELQVDIKIETAKEINLIKTKIQEEIKERRLSDTKSHVEKPLDLSIPVSPTRMGNFHPLTQVARDLNHFFHYYGFSVYDGPDIEDDFHNFEMLGVPIDHPARDLQDTLYILEPDVLLRTQTSSIEARELKAQKPPIRFVAPAHVFRNETANKSNGAFFHQLQGVYVDRDVNMGHLKWIFEKSLKHILGQETKIRFRSKYYPEVEPGMSPDIQCTFCKGAGCEICKFRGWIEIAGGGMIHFSTLEKAGIDPKQYSGFAFGWGLDRIAMAKYKITDLRVMYNGSIVYE